VLKNAIDVGSHRRSGQTFRHQRQAQHDATREFLKKFVDAFGQWVERNLAH
jgi:hypothetical protein